MPQLGRNHGQRRAPHGEIARVGVAQDMERDSGLDPRLFAGALQAAFLVRPAPGLAVIPGEDQVAKGNVLNVCGP